ncbi:MAG TPA: hypothetical protein VMW24_18830 [Sedimentisphaerales bacterium]|nr:hypothetical protein [Sedimentisphaerales bacterium]
MIDVDISQLVPAVLEQFFSSDMMESIIDDLAEGARAKWISLARSELTSAKEDYIRGIQPVESKPGERVITLVGWLPNSVESGIGGYDMRMTLLGPGKGKRNASGGYYRAIPFRHGTPGSQGLAGAPMGSQHAGQMGSERARQMGQDIWDVAKRLRPSKQAQPRSRTSWGDRLRAGMAPKLKPHHKTDIFAGMVKVKHTYQKASGNKYMTFRTISTSNPEGWMHPGITGRHLSEQVEAWIERTAPVMLKRALEGFGR